MRCARTRHQMDIIKQANRELHGAHGVLRCICCLAITMVNIVTSTNPPQQLQLGDIHNFWNENDMVDLDLTGAIDILPYGKNRNTVGHSHGMPVVRASQTCGCHGSDKRKGSSGRRNNTLGGSHCQG